MRCSNHAQIGSSAAVPVVTMGTTCGCCTSYEGNAIRPVEAVNVVQQAKNNATSSPSFPTYCLPMSCFLQLSLMLPHEDVFDKLIQPKDEERMHFISHEWLGFKHPDPMGTQLRRMHEIFTTFIDLKAQTLFKADDWESFLKGVSPGSSVAAK
eukprot:1542628-Amphidinium_carterae.1